jgi:hypothetical protein
MGVACLAIGYPVAAVYVPDENRFAERFRARMQKRHGAVLIPAGPQAMRAALRLLSKRTGQMGFAFLPTSRRLSLSPHARQRSNRRLHVHQL